VLWLHGRMAARSCVACTRPAGEGMILCPFCGDRVADHLAAVPDLHAELALTHARWDVLTVSAGRGGEQGLPFAAAATEAAGLMVSTVGYWAQQVALARASVWQIPNVLVDVARWLAHRVDWLRAMDSAGDAYSQLDRAVCRARSVIDRPAHRTRFPVGPCPEMIGQRYCAHQVVAYVPVRIGIEPAVMRCRNPECRRHCEPWTTDMWREAGRRINRLREHLKRRGLVTRSGGDDSGRVPVGGGLRAHYPALGN
jgi:hypothetical protein